MAQSRLEKIGTIFSRVSSLLKVGALKEESKPVWYELYKAFPPKYEPTYSRPADKRPLRPIFYTEDLIRARFHKEQKHFAMVNMIDDGVCKTEQFLAIYKQLARESVPEDSLFNKAMEQFLTKINSEKVKFEDEKYSAQSVRRRRGVDLKQFLKVEENRKQDMEDKDIEKDPRYKPIRLRLDKVMEELKDADKKPE